MKRVSWIWLAGILAGAIAAGPAAAADLAAHRATYAMNLVEADHTGSPITGARGVMVYAFKDACEAWAVDTQVYLRLLHGGAGKEVESVRTLFSWESKDGLDYRFRLKESRAGEVVEEIKGVAVLGEDAAEGVAEFTHPHPRTVKLPAGSMFPTAHLAALIGLIGAEHRHLTRVVFDGSSLDNPYEISAVVSREPVEAEFPARVRDALTPAPIWSARLAYYPYYKKDEMPEFELTVDFRADGIVTRLLQDFGDYSIQATLDRLEMLPPEVC